MSYLVWPYDLPPYCLTGEVIKQEPDKHGAAITHFEVKGYEGRRFARPNDAILLIDDEAGERLHAELAALREKHSAAAKALYVRSQRASRGLLRQAGATPAEIDSIARLQDTQR